MKNSSGRLLANLLRKSKKISNDKYQWQLLSSTEEENIPKDVPKGHMVVYVGEECKRFIIKVTFLDHPLFRMLLDQAQEEYQFQSQSKLCIPCDEDVFQAILNYVGTRNHQKSWLCS